MMWAKKQGEWIILAVLRMDVFFGLFFGARARTQSSQYKGLSMGRRRFYWANFSPNLVNTSHVDLASFRFLPHTNNA